MTDQRTNIDYRYVEHMVSNIRHSLNVHRKPLPMKGVLLSIHLQSNRPDNFTHFLDDLENSIDDPKNIEVVVKIDDTDEAMNALLPQEVARRPFVVKYISSPLEGGFFELWRSMNDMLEVCDPDAYFVWNMNDEMAVLNKGWDTALKKYVGLFPDHIFRLRTSLFRMRNYCDFWENGFAPETSAINTKRWIDIGGDWNPCLGPDSFQQCVAYYFAWHGRFDKHKPMREIPIHDLTFRGEGAYIGLEGEKLWRRLRGATKAWFRLMSHEIQTEASRRAQKLHAHICAHENRLTDFSIDDNRRKQAIILRDREGDTVIRTFPYALSRLRIGITNMLRSPYYLYYGGGGVRADWPFIISFVKFLALRYSSFEWIYRASVFYSNNKASATIAIYKKGRKIVHSLKGLLRACIQPFLRIGGIMPFPVRRFFEGALNTVQPVIRGAKAIYVPLIQRILNKGYPFEVLLSPYNTVASAIEWRKLDAVLAHAMLPERYLPSRYRNAVIRCILLRRWYAVEPDVLLQALERNIALRYFLGISRYHSLPTVSAIQGLEEILIEHGVLETLVAKAWEGVDFTLFPPFHTSEDFQPRWVAA